MQNVKMFRYKADNGPRLGLELEEGRFDLTSLAPEHFGSVGAWLRSADPLGLLQSAARNVLDPVPGDVPLLTPVDTQEVWAAGVTYERSRVARREESETGGDFYDKVYVADRPELFLKAVGWRVVGDREGIRIRRDSTWDVPEPEMTLVIAASGQIVGVTVGNDVSSRSIEGENPLYLPQAKCYNGAAAIGPMIVPVTDLLSLRERTIQLEIARNEAAIYSEETTTARMKRTPEELVTYLFREMTFPDGAFLMTGTGLVPPDDFSLLPGDVVSITISGVGTLTNEVVL